MLLKRVLVRNVEVPINFICTTPIMLDQTMFGRFVFHAIKGFTMQTKTTPSPDKRAGEKKHIWRYLIPPNDLQGPYPTYVCQKCGKFANAHPKPSWEDNFLKDCEL